MHVGLADDDCTLRAESGGYRGVFWSGRVALRVIVRASGSDEARQLETILQGNGETVERWFGGAGESSRKLLRFAEGDLGVHCDVDVSAGVAVGTGESLLDGGARRGFAGLERG